MSDLTPETALAMALCATERLVADRDAWRARAERAASAYSGIAAREDTLLARLKDAEQVSARLEYRATQAEAQAAAMLASAVTWRNRPCPKNVRLCPCCGEAGDHMADEIDSVAGRTLLAELEELRVLRAHVEVLQAKLARGEPAEELTRTTTVVAMSLVRLAAVDAARKGAT